MSQENEALKEIKEKSHETLATHLAEKHGVTKEQVLDLFKAEEKFTRDYWEKFRPHLPNQLEELEFFVKHFLFRIVDTRLMTINAEKDATLDSLTGLFNRREFDKRINSQPKDSEFCLILFDIDNFKQINDTFGHPIGDVVIKAVARVLSSHTRPCDTSARFGGEEFALIFTDSINNAKILAERIRNDVMKLDIKRSSCDSVKIEGQLNITISAGISLHKGTDSDTVEAIIEGADKALYKAKKDGKNRVVIDK